MMKKAFKKTQRALSKTLPLRKRKTAMVTKATARHDDVQANTSIVKDAAVVDLNINTKETEDEHASQSIEPDLVEEIRGFREIHCKCNPLKDYCPIEIFQSIEDDVLVEPDKVDQETFIHPDQTNQYFSNQESDESLLNIIEKPNPEGMRIMITMFYAFDI